ncbi:hypothetical protein [Clostridium sporogenes]|uniref:hypothetical protein n=1 Tax=Clostridium sporogenes TaxID=1509 RepID=UPI0007176C82|nr:hypothetical protein [Clostridium sporogenes]KRU40044.1 hypothetical protein VT94_25210 [Clostridium sporogenes]MBY7065141.1 hypothetical protein [Clostridium sporogenes]MBY7071813.1 hypothetical protein [Clostridium sporogenes]MCW6065871.1 hypothetical protein [Clostridium sporogenes]OQP88558.1 hypothetical protein VT93_0202020 [Clostridium sporogenes]
MNNEIEILYEEIFNLEKWLEFNIPVLKKCVENMDTSLVNTYINVVFNFYDKGYNFSQYSQECPYLDEILYDYEKFISAYSKLIKFYTCFQIKIPVGVDDYFFKWKRARDVVLKLKCNIDKILREDEDIISEEVEIISQFTNWINNVYDNLPKDMQSTFKRVATESMIEISISNLGRNNDLELCIMNSKAFDEDIYNNIKAKLNRYLDSFRKH